MRVCTAHTSGLGCYSGTQRCRASAPTSKRTMQLHSVLHTRVQQQGREKQQPLSMGGHRTTSRWEARLPENNEA